MVRFEVTLCANKEAGRMQEKGLCWEDAARRRGCIERRVSTTRRAVQKRGDHGEEMEALTVASKLKEEFPFTAEEVEHALFRLKRKKMAGNPRGSL